MVSSFPGIRGLAPRVRFSRRKPSFWASFSLASWYAVLTSETRALASFSSPLGVVVACVQDRASGSFLSLFLKHFLRAKILSTLIRETWKLGFRHSGRLSQAAECQNSRVARNPGVSALREAKPGSGVPKPRMRPSSEISREKRSKQS